MNPRSPELPEAEDNTTTTAEDLMDFARFILMLAGGFVAVTLVTTTSMFLWPESTLWVLLEDRAYKALLAAISFGICLLLGAAAFVFKYIPVVGAVLASMARAAFWVALVLCFMSAMAGLADMPTIAGGCAL